MAEITHSNMTEMVHSNMAEITHSKSQLTVAVICHEATEEFNNLLKQIAETEWINQAFFYDTSKNAVCKKIINQRLSDAKSKRALVVMIHSEHTPILKCDFARIRNQMLQRITTEWFLFLDSDELLSEEACAKIHKVILETNDQENKTPTSAIALPRIDYFLGKKLTHGETGSTYVIRIGKTTRVRFQRNVHEIPVVDGEVITIHTPIFHFAHNSVSEFISSVVQYSYLEAQNRTWKKTSLFELLFYPVGKFVYTFFIKAGFLDGYRGLVYSFCMSLHSFFVRIHVWTK
jgi:hypothetical protein